MPHDRPFPAPADGIRVVAPRGKGDVLRGEKPRAGLTEMMAFFDETLKRAAP